MAVYETRVALPVPQKTVFGFLARPANLAKLAPGDVGLTIVNAPETLSLGSQLEFKIQAFGQVLNFLHEITAFEEHSQIVEKQVKGFFGRWLQEQRISTDANGEAQVDVRVDFDPPGGLLGLLVTKGKLLEYLEDGFEHRHEAMRKILVAQA